ncbi:reverse transcriptase domain-containing protein [Azospirillum brasilense]|uniref:reverse transcriptase domain-containing protein n=1 Tax=Azospirillum brasilense TaxID=192 RepID=UPI0015868EA6|nr:reverse transcriptase domain-containing protein [Azospirillum brasilense]
MAVPALQRLARISNLKAVWDASGDAKGGKKAAGPDGRRPEAFALKLIDNLSEVRVQLLDGSFRFDPLRAVAFQKPNSSKYRIICIPNVRDRLVQRALVAFLTKETDRLKLENNASFGFISGRDRGVAGAVKTACRRRGQLPWAFKSDILSFFDEIDRQILVDRLRRCVRSVSVLKLLEQAVNCEIGEVDPDTRKKIATTSIRNGKGLRQGMPLSPVLSNFFLAPFDRHFNDRRENLVRYADDFIVFAESREECEAYHTVCCDLLSELNLGIPAIAAESKTKIYAPDEPAEFLGYEISPISSRRYRPRIPEVAFRELTDKVRSFQSYSTVPKKAKSIESALAQLGRIVDGYVHAYHLGDNIKDLESHLINLQAQCRQRLFESLFGNAAVAALTVEQRKFLSLT